MLRLSEDERRDVLRNEFKQIFPLSDEEIVDEYIRLIDAMNRLEADEKFKLFKSTMECLHDDFGLQAMERVHKAYLTALSRFPRSVRKRDSADTFNFLSKLEDKYRDAFVKSSKEAFKSLPSDVRTTLENSLSQDIVNLLSR